ncbi:hypothetical protein NDU88_002855 [Pleurodeles waltl]|uniref:Uncharacterized protein n=1 Tax=Pleurodeles waltl TaxID=8319 RepID=A0AAV7M9E2_PLEWA|nr:hypothetical protein NDU88_002855 [Pleurodeles waltl]
MTLLSLYNSCKVNIAHQTDGRIKSVAGHAAPGGGGQAGSPFSGHALKSTAHESHGGGDSRGGARLLFAIMPESRNRGQVSGRGPPESGKALPLDLPMEGEEYGYMVPGAKQLWRGSSKYMQAPRTKLEGHEPQAIPLQGTQVQGAQERVGERGPASSLVAALLEWSDKEDYIGGQRAFPGQEAEREESFSGEKAEGDGAWHCRPPTKGYGKLNVNALGGEMSYGGRSSTGLNCGVGQWVEHNGGDRRWSRDSTGSIEVLGFSRGGQGVARVSTGHAWETGGWVGTDLTSTLGLFSVLQASAPRTKKDLRELSAACYL